MATGDVILARGTYATVQAANSTADADVSAGTITNIGAALAATEEDYPLLDFKLSVTFGTPTADTTVDLYRRPDDGTNAAPAPTSSYLHEFIESFQLDDLASSQYYYVYGIPNIDQNDEYYIVNNAGATLTIALAARGRTTNVAA